MTEINMSLLQEFIEESREHLDEMESLLLQLVHEPDDTNIFNDVFRTMHNIKGASQLTGLEKISKLSHKLEDLLDLLRQQKMVSNNAIVDILIAGRDRIVQLVAELEDAQQEISSVEELVNDLAALIASDGTEISAQSIEFVSRLSSPGENSSTNTFATYAENYEEHDQELFGIFIAHLKEQFSYLLSIINHLETSSEKEPTLAHSNEIIKKLWFSANYMGYEDLANLYVRWSENLEEARNAFKDGKTVALDFMRGYLDQLVKQYPQLESCNAEDGAASKITVSNELLEPDNIADNELEDEDISASVLEAFNSEEAYLDNESTASENTDTSMPLLDDFIEEAVEHLDEMEYFLLQLANEPADLDLLNNIFRTIHNIKGNSQLTGLDKISRLSQRLEDLLDLLRQEKIGSSDRVVEVLIVGRDRITQLVQELESARQEVSTIDDLLDSLTILINGETEQRRQESKDNVSADASSATTFPGSNIASYFEEENDKELFNIFITHLQEQIGYLRTKIKDLRNKSNQEDNLLRCLEVLQRLRSSSNYMGYDELTELYEHWHESVKAARHSILNGEESDMQFMSDYLEQLTGIFPQLEKPVDSQEHAVPVVAEIPTSADNFDKSELAKVTSDVNSLQQNELFNRLNKALDISLQQVSSNENEALNEVFDELVSSQKERNILSTAAKSAIAEKRALLAQLNQKQEQSKSDDKKDKKVKKTIRVDADKIDALMNQVGELVVDRSFFYQLFNEMRDLQGMLKENPGIDQKDIKLFRTFTYRLSEAISALGRTSNELQEGVMKMRMLPISHIFNRYPRLVHDLTRNIDKKVNLVVRGEETELDKMIVEELSDPLIHIIRNAIDHGIESTEERKQAGKSETGTLELEAYQESNHIVIEVTDDGRGINLERIKSKAVERGLYSSDEVNRFSSRDLTNLILTPGFSTAEKITGTSGRGVGMDVVKKNIEKLNGALEIDTTPGQKTQMRLKIPLTLAIIHALMVRVGSDMFTIPLANVDETVRIDKDDTSIVEGVEVIHLRGVALPIFRLSSLFNVPADKNSEKSFVVIVDTDGQRTGFVVDELLGQEEVVIKPLEDYVQEKSGFSGATIIGEGRISLILDVYELVKMTTTKQVNKHKKQAAMLKNIGKFQPSQQGHEMLEHV